MCCHRNYVLNVAVRGEFNFELRSAVGNSVLSFMCQKLQAQHIQIARQMAIHIYQLVIKKELE